MQLPFFYEENLPDSDQFILSPETSKHISQVLRMKEGEQILLTNGKGQTKTAAIVLSDKKKTEVKIKNQEFVCQPHPQICIAISLIKNTSRFEWFLEKATEIGVNAIIPLICQRTEKSHLRDERMKTILISAMLQSRQAWLPGLSVPRKINEFLKSDSQYHQKFIAHCVEEEKKDLKDFKLNNSSTKLILIGPEGDFTKEEIDLAIEQNYIPVSLGPTRLRTETAALVAAVLLK